MSPDESIIARRIPLCRQCGRDYYCCRCYPGGAIPDEAARELNRLFDLGLPEAERDREPGDDDDE